MALSNKSGNESSDTEPVEKQQGPDKWINGTKVRFIHTPSPASNVPGGDFQADLPGYGAGAGDSFEEALENLEQRVGAKATDEPTAASEPVEPGDDEPGDDETGDDTPTE